MGRGVSNQPFRLLQNVRLQDLTLFIGCSFPPQRHPQRPTHHLGWTCPRPSRALYGSPGGHAEVPGDSDLVPALVSGGEGEEAGIDCLHEEAAEHSECHAEERAAVAGCGQSADLIFKAVADPHHHIPGTQPRVVPVRWDATRALPSVAMLKATLR